MSDNRSEGSDRRSGDGRADGGPGGDLSATSEEARRYYQQNHGGTTAHNEARVVPAATVTRGREPHPDPHYHQWREQQIDALDRDYDDYRARHGSDPAHHFGTWRATRQSQRDALRSVREHMEVVGSDGGHVGTVDKIGGETIILTRTDPAAGGVHHAIPSSWIQGVGDKVMLDRPAQAAREGWSRVGDEAGGERSRALGESRNRGSEGPHILDRSFSGTYKD